MKHNRFWLWKVLLEKRVEIYEEVSEILWEVEEALEKKDWETFWNSFSKARKRIRISLPFLSDQVLYELEKLEALLIPYSQTKVNLPEETIRRQLLLLNTHLAKLIQSDSIPHLEEIFPKGVEQEVQRSEEELQEKKQQEKAREEAESLAQRAEQFVREKKYQKAIQALKKAIQLDPERPVYHNDLGVVYALAEQWKKAEQEYLEAIALNEKFPERRTSEWSFVYFNLGKLYLRLGKKSLLKRPIAASDIEAAYHFYQKAEKAFCKFIPHTLGEKREEAERLLQFLREEKKALEQRLERIGIFPSSREKETEVLEKPEREEKIEKIEREEKERERNPLFEREVFKVEEKASQLLLEGNLSPSSQEQGEAPEEVREEEMKREEKTEEREKEPWIEIEED